MPTAPTRIARVASVFNSTATPKTLAMSGLLVGDLITLFVLSENNQTPAHVFTPTATGITFTSRGSVIGTTGDRCVLVMWTGAVTAAGSPTISITHPTGTTQNWGAEATVWRNHGGFGVAGTASVTTAGQPSVTITTTALSAVVCGIADWSAGAVSTKTWRTLNGSTPTNANGQETMATAIGTNYTVYSAYWPSAAAGSSVVGMTAPTQRYTIGAMSVLPLPDPVASDYWGIPA